MLVCCAHTVIHQDRAAAEERGLFPLEEVCSEGIVFSLSVFLNVHLKANEFGTQRFLLCVLSFMERFSLNKVCDFFT